MDGSITKSYKRDPTSHVLINTDEKEYKDHTFKLDVFKQINLLHDQVKRLTVELQHTKARLAKIEESSNVKTV